LLGSALQPHCSPRLPRHEPSSGTFWRLTVVMKGVRPTDAALVTLLRDRGDALLRTATLLAGDHTGGQDLLQAALERAMRSPSREPAAAEAHLRRTMYHLAIDSWRARRRRPEVFAEIEPPAQSDPGDRVAMRTTLLNALAELSARQRAVLVLRFFEDCSESQTAELLGCSLGTVKSSASRGLARLRAITALWSETERAHR
jgi:RNA polymerase sigma-70 factor (sigma-E family)